MTETTSLWALFVSSFLAATILPGGSELVLYGILKFNPEMVASAVGIATIGNTLGGLSSYAIGRLIPQRRQPWDSRERSPQTARDKGAAAIQRYGAPVLLLSWVPLVGDAFCVAAGWFRMNPFLAAFYMAVGKFARYLLIALIP